MKTGQRILDDLRFMLDCDDAEIARRCDIHYNTVRQISTGKRNGSIKTLRTIVEGCGLRLSCYVERGLNE